MLSERGSTHRECEHCTSSLAYMIQPLEYVLFPVHVVRLANKSAQLEDHLEGPKVAQNPDLACSVAIRAGQVVDGSCSPAFPAGFASTQCGPGRILHDVRQ